MFKKITTIFCAIMIFSQYISDDNQHNYHSKKILIVSLRATGGHKAVSDALSVAFNSISIPCEVIYIDDWILNNLLNVDIIEKTYKTDTLYNNIFSITKNTTILYYGTIIGGYVFIKNINVKLLHKNVVEINPDIILCVSHIAAHNVHEILSRLEKNVPLIIIPTDLSGSIIKWFIKPKLTDNIHYLTCGPMLYWDTINRYHRYKNIKVFNINGLPLRKLPIISQTEARRQLNIKHDKEVVVICFGSIGNKAMIEYMLYSLENDEKLINHTRQYILIFGKAQDLADQANTLLQSKNISDDQITVIGFTDKILTYIASADVCVGKAGPTTITECIACQTIPLILSTQIHEECNIMHFHDAQKIGVICKCTAKDILNQINYIFANKNYLQSKIKTYIPNIEYMREKLQSEDVQDQDITNIVQQCKNNTGTQDVVEYVMKILDHHNYEGVL